MSHASSTAPAASDDVDSDYVVDDSEYEADLTDRTGLPVIPRGMPVNGDTIDIAGISREFATRAMKRSSPAAAPLTDVELTSIPTSRPRDDDEEFDDFSYEAPPRRPIHRSLPKKTSMTAFFLLGVGVIFSVLGLSFLFTLGLTEALPFLIIGGIGFIPGSYVSFIIYQTWKGVPGYSYDQIPSYDD